MGHGSFPHTRLRRTRQHAWSRRLVAEHHLLIHDLIWPVFVCEGKNQRIPVPSMPGVERLSIDQLVIEAEHAFTFGIPAIALFPVIDEGKKSERAEEALRPDNLVGQAVAALKQDCAGSWSYL